MFDPVCPFCGQRADGEVGRVISYNVACACGAIALGAPPYDFDEVIDDAINYYGLRPGAATVNFAPLDQWLEAYGIAVRPAGRVAAPTGHEAAWCWFKRVRDAAPPQESPAMARIAAIVTQAFAAPDPALLAELAAIEEAARAGGRELEAAAAANARAAVHDLVHGKRG